MDMIRREEKTSRRSFVSRSVLTAGGIAGLLSARSALAQGPPAGESKSVVNLSGQKIVLISMVVKDAEKVARRFSDVFGPSWKFYEMRPKQLVLHDKELGDADCLLKLAIGFCGGRTFKLVQPVSGQSSYSEFLQKQGEGFYSIGLGSINGDDRMVSALKKAGVGVEMQCDVGDGSKLTILETGQELGCRIEFAGIPKQAEATSIRQTGSYTAKGPGIMNMDRPIITGGRRFGQVGIVIDDEKRAAKRYEELFGIGGWRFMSIPVVKASLNGKPVPEADLPSLEVGMGGASLGDMSIELLAPVKLNPGGVHRAFFDKHGNGFQHLMVNPPAGDHDANVDALLKAGMKMEVRATIKLGNFTASGDYIGMEEQLGGFVLEYNG